MIAVTSETLLWQRVIYLAAFFMDDYYIRRTFLFYISSWRSCIIPGIWTEVFAQFLDGAAEEDKLSLNKNMLENPEMLDAVIPELRMYSATRLQPFTHAPRL